MRSPLPRSLTAGLLGGSLAASGVSAANAAAPSVEPAVGPPSVGDRPEATPSSVGTYEFCSALFPALTKSDLAVIEIDVEGGDGVLPDPLPGVPGEITPVVQIDDGFGVPVECVPDVAWTDQAEMWEFTLPFTVAPTALDDPDKLLALPGTNYFTIPTAILRVSSADVGPSIVEPTVTIRFEHSLPDGLVVTSDPEDITDAWGRIETLFSDYFANPDYAPLFLARIVDAGYPDEAALIERLALSSDCDNSNPDNQFTPEEVAAVADALTIVFGLPASANDQSCSYVEQATVLAALGFTIGEVVDGLQVVTVTIDGPAPTTTTTTTTTTTIATDVLPATGVGTNWSVSIAGLLTAIGMSGVLATRRRRVHD